MHPSPSIILNVWHAASAFLLLLYVLPRGGVDGLATSSPSSSNVPSWSDLTRSILPSSPPPPTVDCVIASSRRRPDERSHTAAPSFERDASPTLYRERHGWCVNSARLWLAIETKGVRCNTVRVEARGDTYDGSPTQGEVDGTDGRPVELAGRGLPQLGVYGAATASGDADDDGQEVRLLSGEDDAACLSLLRKLDDLFPDAKPLWPPLNDDGNPACTVQDASAAAEAFMPIAPGPDVCRPSSRAAWLFCAEEGYRLDPLPRETLESVLDSTEQLLRRHSDGPFFCGDAFSAADVFWSPLLERYAAQLPCLHSDLRPRGNIERWPNLNQWYDAMDRRVPAYSCRIRGHAPSWRKVLYRDPWWPDADLWHPRDTVGPKGELKATEEEVVEAFGGGDVTDEVWSEYADSGPYVARTPEKETAACLIRNKDDIRSM